MHVLVCVQLYIIFFLFFFFAVYTLDIWRSLVVTHKYRFDFEQQSIWFLRYNAIKCNVESDASSRRKKKLEIKMSNYSTANVWKWMCTICKTHITLKKQNHDNSLSTTCNTFLSMLGTNWNFIAHTYQQAHTHPHRTPFDRRQTSFFRTQRIQLTHYGWFKWVWLQSC